jgi:biotin carboxyl carrier protein
MRYFVTFGERDAARERVVEVTQLPAGGLEVRMDGALVDVDVVQLADALSIRIDGRVLDLTVEGEPPDLGVVNRSVRAYVGAESERMRAANAARGHVAEGGNGVVVSPMPGRVVKLLVAKGDAVEPGTPLVVVEAMKMENELRSTCAGTVSDVFVAAGATVEGGAKLVAIA